jgi:predicted glycosyltransferase involved in capsule biosynthesis
MCYKINSWIGQAPKEFSKEPTQNAPCSGINVIPRSVWEDIGGFDENFVGWGFEDQAYLYKYFKKYGKIYDFIPGAALSINHEKEWNINYNNNRNYYDQNYSFGE